MTSSSLEVVALDAPGTVAAARRWLRGEITWASDEFRDLAELVLSELVTNAVLHAPGPMRVSLSRRADCVALEVVDTDVHHVPVVRRYSNEASTGRGLQVVEQLADRWGVRGLAAGKGVWAVLGGADDPGRCADEFTPGTWLLDDPTRELAPAAPAVAAGPLARSEAVPLHLVGLPLWVYFAAQEHNDTLLREFRLLASADESAHVPARLLTLAEDTRHRFAAEGTVVRGQVADAVAAGHPTVDLHVVVPRLAWDLLGRLASALDEADDYCASGDLLTLVSPPVVRHFRDWYSGELRAQLEGATPSPWAGPFEPPAPQATAGADKEHR